MNKTRQKIIIPVSLYDCNKIIDKMDKKWLNDVLTKYVWLMT